MSSPLLLKADLIEPNEGDARLRLRKWKLYVTYTYLLGAWICFAPPIIVLA